MITMLTELQSEYSVEVDTVDKTIWNCILERFDDANIYQTWSYEEVKSGINNMSHLLLKKNGDVVAAAQARIAKIPFTSTGVAYIRWGPLWRLRGKAEDREVFKLAIRALRNEYVCQRRLLLRILPLIFNDQFEIFNSILMQEAFNRVSIEEAQRTLLVNLSHPIEELKKGLNQKWRNSLNRAEKNNLIIVEGFDNDLFGLFIEIYRQMHGRKKFMETSDVNQFRMIQRDLPDSFKMKIMIAISNGQPAAGVIYSSIGDMGIYLYGGTSNVGLSTNGSYLLQWNILSSLKNKGVIWYNLHGINPVKNPGTYKFKLGFCGKNGKDVFYLGTYDSCNEPITQAIVRFANLARVIYKKCKMALMDFANQG